MVETREPGGSPGAEAIRALLLQGDEDRWRPGAEALLFAAARADHVAKLAKAAVTGEHPGLDGLTFDADGNVYVTDAHQGIIWRVGKEGRCSNGLGHEPASQANEAAARHRRKWPRVQ